MTTTWTHPKYESLITAKRTVQASTDNLADPNLIFKWEERAINRAVIRQGFAEQKDLTHSIILKAVKGAPKGLEVEWPL